MSERITEYFISNLYKYSSVRIRKMFPGSGLNYKDVAHSVIAHEEFSIHDWIRLVDRVIYEEIAHKKKYAPLEACNSTENKAVENKQLCPCCNEELPISKFKCGLRTCCSCYYQKNKQRFKESAKMYYHKNKDNEEFRQRKKSHQRKYIEKQKNINKIKTDI